MRQRGQALLYLVGAIALIGVLAGLVFACNHYISGVDSKGYDRGKKETEAYYAQRDNQALRDAIVAKQAAENRVAATEKKAQQTFDLLAADYQKDVDNEATRNRAVLDFLRAGHIVLHDPGATACSSNGAGGAAGQVTGAAGGGDGQTGSRLSDQAAEFLLSEAQRADGIVHQLTACQAVITKDREQ